METAFLLVGLAVIVLAGTALSDRLRVPAPLTLIAVGVALSYVPQVPEVRLEPEVVLLGLLPPLLYAAALQTSLVDFRANQRAILLLSVGLVVVTTLGVGAVVHVLVPGLPWWAALAIGAVVAPPDAVAATAIGRRIGLPRKIVTVLEGESLLNDATALVALRTAVAAGIGAVTAMEVGLDFARAAGGGLVIGFAIFLLVARVRRQVQDPLLDTAISLVIPFGAYVIAERVHASGVIAVVVAGLLLGHKAPILQSAQSRITERTNWRTIAFVLENAVFLLIGLQASWILSDVADSELGRGRVLAVCAATLAAVIAIRLLWMFTLGSWLTPGRTPSTYRFLTGWAGMRGVVTLAAAFVIPDDTEHREVLLLVAFTVVAGTLFLQGLTLPWLARRLDVPPPDPAEDALARATLLQQASKAGQARLEELEYDDPTEVCEQIRQRITARNNAAWEQLGTRADQETPSELYSRVRLEMLQAERQRVLEVRSEGKVPSEVVSQVLAMLDVEESMLDRRAADTERVRTAVLAGRGIECEDLERYPVAETPDDPVCQTCLDEGTHWVALRQCLECGVVACCDSSPRQHATQHFHDTQHPVVESAEPSETWRWCYVHHVTA